MISSFFEPPRRHFAAGVLSGGAGALPDRLRSSNSSKSSLGACGIEPMQCRLERHNRGQYIVIKKNIVIKKRKPVSYRPSALRQPFRPKRVRNKSGQLRVQRHVPTKNAA